MTRDYTTAEATVAKTEIGIEEIVIAHEGIERTPAQTSDPEYTYSSGRSVTGAIEDALHEGTEYPVFESDRATDAGAVVGDLANEAESSTSIIPGSDLFEGMEEEEELLQGLPAEEQTGQSGIFPGGDLMEVPEDEEELQTLPGEAVMGDGGLSPINPDEVMGDGGLSPIDPDEVAGDGGLSPIDPNDPTDQATETRSSYDAVYQQQGRMVVDSDTAGEVVKSWNFENAWPSKVHAADEFEFTAFTEEDLLDTAIPQSGDAPETSYFIPEVDDEVLVAFDAGTLADEWAFVV